MFELPEKLPLTFTCSLGEYKDVFSPNDGKLITKVQQATNEDIDFILNETVMSKKIASQKQPLERSETLKLVAHHLSKSQDFLAKVIATEGGKPLKDALIEVKRAILTLELCAEEAMRLQGEIIPMNRSKTSFNHFAYTAHVPIGCVFAISAFNHPLNLIAHQVGCAVAAGCSVILKPASATPLSAYYLHEAFLKSGIDINTFRIIHAPIVLIEKILSSKNIDFVNFVGSPKVGWEIRKKIAPGTRIALEHGGQAPAIVREDADLTLAVTSLIRSSFYHAGQVCISTQRIFVHEKIYDLFLEKFKAETSKLMTGSAILESTDVGPLIRTSEVSRIKTWISEAIEDGATLILGNKSFGNLNQFLAPTILGNTPRNSTIMKEEVFGPVVSINSYNDEEELLDYLNSNRYVFEAAVFTQNINHALQMAQKISAMTFVINNHTAFRVDQMPFGGHKESGLGMGGVKYAIHEMTNLKQIIINLPTI